MGDPPGYRTVNETTSSTAASPPASTGIFAFSGTVRKSPALRWSRLSPIVVVTLPARTVLDKSHFDGP